MSGDLPDRDGDGYLVSMDDWTPEIDRAMAEADGSELDDEKWENDWSADDYLPSPLATDDNSVVRL